jgi:hypothetical protein
LRPGPPDDWRTRGLTTEAHARDPQQLLIASADVTPPT